LLERVENSQGPAAHLEAETLRTLLLLLYGTGLRVGEARRLTLADADLQEALLTIRATKFYKNRLVPVGPQLAGVLHAYMPLRRKSYRDTFSLLLPFISGKLRKPVDRLAVHDLTSRHVLQFLAHLE